MSQSFGVNSDGGGYEGRDEREALAMRDRLSRAFPDLISRVNPGYSPADSLSHAESTILMRAARENGNIGREQNQVRPTNNVSLQLPQAFCQSLA